MDSPALTTSAGGTFLAPAKAGMGHTTEGSGKKKSPTLACGKDGAPGNENAGKDGLRLSSV